MYKTIKRLFDILFALVFAIILSPLICLVLLLKYLEDLGNPVYISERVGFRKKTFKLYKVRSMSVGKHELHHPTASDKSPITPFGKILRSTKLDELLQILNVLNGSMTIVGRRPDIPVIVESGIYDHTTDFIFLMKPGLTDLACLFFPDLTKHASKHKNPHDFYVKNVWPVKKELIWHHFLNQSFVFEFYILMLTPIAIAMPALSRFIVLKSLGSRGGNIGLKMNTLSHHYG